MAGWSGFTEKDLQKLKREEVDEKVSKLPQKPKPSKTDQRPRKEKTLRKAASSSVKPVDTSSKNMTVNDKGVEKDNDMELKGEIPKLPTPINEVKQSESPEKTLDDSSTGNDNEENIRVLTDVEAAEMQMSSLEKLQMEQKLIEDQNKKKKTIIKEALAERMRQTQHESMKLKEIKIQLTKLDQLLQADVEILRNKIDHSCAEFSHAQKRFQFAEQEYVLAKLDFYKKKEHKDQLQECLYTIIQENEKRKAKKLEELMLKLNSDSDSVPSSPVNENLSSSSPLSKETTNQL